MGEKIKIYIALIFILVCIYYIYIYIQKIKIVNAGKLGENQVKLILAKLNKSKYYVMNNVILKHTNGNTTQIDHIIIYRKGIFVVETKNYAGVLYGNVNKKYWMHISGKNKHTVYNIIYQNQGHIDAIKSNVVDVIDYMPDKKCKKFFVSILLFKDGCIVKIKKPLFYKANFKVCKFNKLIKTIKKGHRRNIVSKQTYKNLISEIERKNIVSRRNISKHIKQVKNIKY